MLVHAVAFAPCEELAGRFSETSREGFHTALDVSTYSLLALARRAAPLMPPGARRSSRSRPSAAVTVLPRYNVMGVAKAALEACVRYLADDLGPQGIRVNALSPGAVKTLAASSVPGFRDAYRQTARITPLRTNVTQDDVGRTALWLCSDWARAVTGEIVYVDAGYHILGATTPAGRRPTAPPRPAGCRRARQLLLDLALEDLADGVVRQALHDRPACWGSL